MEGGAKGMRELLERMEQAETDLIKCQNMILLHQERIDELAAAAGMPLPSAGTA